MKKYKSKNTFLDLRELFGEFGGGWYKILILLGARGFGKTYGTQNYLFRQFFKKGRKFIWLRLKEPAVKALLSNNAKDFFNSTLLEKWKITGVKVIGNNVYITRGNPEDKTTYMEICKIMALSTFYTMKGVDLQKDGNKKKVKEEFQKNFERQTKKYYNIVLDEMNAEKAEKRTFDITYAYVNMIETITRNDLDRRLILTGNTLDEGSEILSNCFEFIPEEFGIYKIYKKRTIIHYMESSEKYKEEKKKSFSGLLLANASTFTNEVDFKDQDLIVGKDNKPIQSIIRFDKDKYYTLTDGVISHKKIPKNSNIPVIALSPLIGGLPFYQDVADDFISRVYMRLFKFDTRVSCVKFHADIRLLKGIK